MPGPGGVGVVGIEGRASQAANKAVRLNSAKSRTMVFPVPIAPATVLVSMSPFPPAYEAGKASQNMNT